MWNWLHRWGSPQYFYRFTTRLLPWISLITLLLFSYGLYGALISAPADYQQGDAFRIIYIHVPCAFLSLMIYTIMTLSAFVFMVWRIKLADVFQQISGKIGFCFTFITLLTGSLWGKPMWGTWWIWDARLTSECILCFIYLGIIALQQTIPHAEQRSKATAIMILVGSVDLPIIHYSVNWWNTLHQGATLSLLHQPSIDQAMLIPLLVMIAAFTSFSFILLLRNAQTEILWRERKSQWVTEVLS
jgi:heme exporter protein C